MGHPQRSRRGLLLAAAAAVLVLTGAVLLAIAWAGQQAPPQAPAAAPTTAGSGLPSRPAPGESPTAPGEPTSTAPAVRPTAAGLERSVPTRVQIPSIGVDSSLLHLGLADDGTVAVPQPGPGYDKAAWFTGSPTPGEVGPAVLEGHVDSVKNGPSVFYRLGALKKGATVAVTREDGQVVEFTVDRAVRYPKDAFPTLEVYGNTDGPELRLITCGGSFDSGAGHYRDNVVVYAHLA